MATIIFLKKYVDLTYLLLCTFNIFSKLLLLTVNAQCVTFFSLFFSITTKIPVLENVYETLMKQQKILSLLKRRTEKLEKNITNVACHLARGLQLNMSNISRHYLTNTITDE